jgi:PAS domain S-box-containing protein
MQDKRKDSGQMPVDLSAQCPEGTSKLLPKNSTSEDWREVLTQKASCATKKVEALEEHVRDCRVMQKELEESREHLRITLDSIGDAVIVTDPHGVVCSFNPMAAKLTGWSAAQATGRPLDEVFNIINAQTGKKVDNPVQRVVAAGGSVGLANHTVLISLSGERHHIADSAAPIFGADGAVKGVVLVFRDVTEGYHIHQELQQQRSFLRLLIDQTPNQIFWKDRNLTYLGCNQMFATIAGVGCPDNVAGKTDYDFQRDHADTEAYRELDRKVIESGKPVLGLEEHYFTSEGNEGYVLTYKVPIRNADNEIIGVLGTCTDITERKRAEEKLKESEARFRELADMLPEAIFEADASLHLTYCNHKTLALFGYEEKDFSQGVNLLELVASADRERAQGNIAQQAGAPADDLTEYAGQRKDGSQFPLLLRVASVIKHQELGGYRGVIFDITERKREEEDRANLQAQLAQAQKMESVGRLAGGVAHDFNNMLGVILCHTDMLLEGVPSDNPLRAGLEEIQKAARRSADLTRQLLAFARKQTIEPKALNLNDTVEGLLKMLQRLIGEEITLNWKPSLSLWTVKMDPAQIDQILVNLCVNARDAIAGVGRITVESRNVVFDEAYCAGHADFIPGDYVLLTVSDDGCGMDAVTLSHIFEPFYTTKEMGKGTGLGLATVYGAIKQNNGFIHVYSEPGQGATFNIYLPRHMAENMPLPEKAPVQTVSCGHETILLVEDEPAILEMTTLMLERQGYTLLAASCPAEALRLAKEYTGRIDLLLTDVIMPELNGRDLAKNLLSIFPGLKRVFMSGYTADIIAHHGVMDEGEHFIQKPFSSKELTAKLREALE